MRTLLYGCYMPQYRYALLLLLVPVHAGTCRYLIVRYYISE